MHMLTEMLPCLILSPPIELQSDDNMMLSSSDNVCKGCRSWFNETAS